MPDHKDRPPTTLAHGSAKSSDIERVRQNVDNAGEKVANAARVSAERERRRRSRRAAGRSSTK